MDLEEKVTNFVSKLSEIEIKNPLFMEDILPHIFHYLPLGDLSNCSTVCLFWRQIAWVQIILEKQILFRNIKEVKDYITTFKNNNNGSKRQRFEPVPSSLSSSSSTQLFSLLKPVLFKNYKFYLDWENMIEVIPIRNNEVNQEGQGQDNNDISIKKASSDIDNVIEKGAILQEFFVNFHKYIFSLDIHKSSTLILPILAIQKEQYSTNIFCNLKNLCLNINQLNEELLLPDNNNYNIISRLEYLKLCCNNIKSTDLPKIIQFLQQSTINLKGLKLQIPTATICNNNNNQIIIKNISKDLLNYLINVYKLDRLVNFDYKFPIDSIDLFTLTNCKLTNFKSISLRLADNNTNNSNINADSLYNFLESLIQLENLYLKFINWWNSDLPKQIFLFPYLTNLKKLKLKNYRGDLKFLINTCPNLNELEILFWRAEIQYITVNYNNSNNDRPWLNYNNEIQNIKLLPILLHSKNVILVNPPEKCLNSVKSLIVELAGFPNHFIILEYLTTMFPNLNKFQYDANVSVSEKSQLSEYIKEKLPQLNSLFIQKIPKKVLLLDFSHSVHMNGNEL